MENPELTALLLLGEDPPDYIKYRYYKEKMGRFDQRELDASSYTCGGGGQGDRDGGLLTLCLWSGSCSLSFLQSLIAFNRAKLPRAFWLLFILILLF